MESKPLTMAQSFQSRHNIDSSIMLFKIPKLFILNCFYNFNHECHKLRVGPSHFPILGVSSSCQGGDFTHGMVFCSSVLCIRESAAFLWSCKIYSIWGFFYFKLLSLIKIQLTELLLQNNESSFLLLQ